MTSLRNTTPSLLLNTQQSGYKRPSFEYLLLMAVCGTKVLCRLSYRLTPLAAPLMKLL